MRHRRNRRFRHRSNDRGRSGRMNGGEQSNLRSISFSNGRTRNNIVSHQNAEKFPIQWDGDITQVGKDQQNDNIPTRVDLTWNAGSPITPYVACWDDGNGGVDGSQCTADVDSYFFEDFDINQDGVINVTDVIALVNIIID